MGKINLNNVDQDAVDELILFSQNTEHDYIRALKLVQRLVKRVKGEAKLNNCKSETIEERIKEVSFENSRFTQFSFKTEAGRLHRSYMENFGLKNGYVKSRLSAATIKKLSEELWNVYQEDISGMLNHPESYNI